MNPPWAISVSLWSKEDWCDSLIEILVIFMKMPLDYFLFCEESSTTMTVELLFVIHGENPIIDDQHLHFNSFFSPEVLFMMLYAVNGLISLRPTIIQDIMV